MNREMASLDGVFELLTRRLAEVDIDIADIPFAGDFVGQSAGQLEAQLRFPVDGKGICKIGGIAGVIIIVAVVAHEIADAGSLTVEIGDAEGRSTLDEAFRFGGVDKRLHRGGEVDIADGVVDAAKKGGSRSVDDLISEKKLTNQTGRVDNYISLNKGEQMAIKYYGRRE